MVNCLVCCLCFIIFLADRGLGFNDCNTSTCGSFGPPVRFPFRIRGKQPLHCGYPQSEFYLSCSEKNDTVLQLPNSWKLFIQKIDYKSQVIYAKDSGGCLFRRLISNLSLSVSPFELMNTRENITLFKCPSRKIEGWSDYAFQIPFLYQIPCLSDLHYDFLGGSRYCSIDDPDLLSCTIIHYYPEVAGRSMDNVEYRESILGLNWSNPLLILNWTNPTCKSCEARGKYCRLKMSTIASEMECYGSLKPSKGTYDGFCWEIYSHSSSLLIF